MNSSLSRKILFPTLLLIAIGLVTTLVVTYLSARQAVLDESEQRLQRETKLAARLIDNWLQARLIDLHLWAQEETLIDLITAEGNLENRGEKAKRFLATQQSGHTYMEGIFIADTKGTVLFFSTIAAQPLAKVRLIDRLYFLETLSGKQVISPLMQSKLSGSRVFVVTAPIKVGEEIKGVIGGVVDFSAFTDLFINNFEDQKNKLALICDAKGVILTSSQPQIKILPEPLASALTSTPSQLRNHPIGSSDHLISGQFLHNTNWLFAISQPMDVALCPLNKAGQFSTLLATVLLVAISLIVFNLFHRLLNQRLQAMIQIIGQVKRGDLSCRIHQSMTRKDEVNDLADSFNQMIEQLEDNISLLNREIQMRRDSEHMLSYHQQNLETIIAERSRALESEIIERKQIEERLARSEKLEMIGHLAGGVAHDLNNILSGIVTYPDLLLLKIGPDHPLAAPLLSIKRTGEKAAAIVQDLLTLSGHRRLNKKPTDFNLLLSTFLCSKEYREFLKRFPHVHIQSTCSGQPAFIQGSAAALSNVLLHLVGYAAMMLGADGGEVVLKTEHRTLAGPIQAYELIEAGPYCILTMEYSGRILQPEHLARIFEPFYTSKKLGLQGSGLEMAVILGTLKDHRGFIDCSSESPSGSRFSLYFPTADAPSLQAITCRE
ncbi:MAG: cache domain-containing protein [Desulfobulbus sp.]|nr:cache domain-containing protein [Desulfobulbus sp.]